MYNLKLSLKKIFELKIWVYRHFYVTSIMDILRNSIFKNKTIVINYYLAYKSILKKGDHKSEMYHKVCTTVSSPTKLFKNAPRNKSCENNHNARLCICHNKRMYSYLHVIILKKPLNTVIHPIFRERQIDKDTNY